MNRPRRRALGLLLAMGVALPGTPRPAGAACDCGYADGRFTTHSGIVIDGAMTDWSAVLADTDNRSCDGGAPNIAPQPDRDAPVQSTGRDLLEFAYTWDDARVQTLTGRVASSSNVQRFIYYADLDNDGLMETGERVIVAGWKGSNRAVDLYLGHYVSSAPGGDPMVDGSGHADGYTLPGTVPDLPSTGNPDYSGNWGSADGLSMEWSVPWADAPGAPGLGLASGAAFTFHVSSTNSNPGAASFPDQVDDNMAGCGGGVASTQYAELDYSPDRSLTTGAGTTVYAAHRVRNLGNGIDTFDLSAGAPTGSHSPAVSFFSDADQSGTWTGGDLPLADTGGGPDVDTGPVAAGDSAWILVAYVVAPAASGAATVVSTARSAHDTNRTDTVTDTITVLALPSLSVGKTARTVSDPVTGTSPLAKSIPAAQVEYEIEVVNRGAGPADANSVQLTDRIPAGTKLVVADLGPPGSGPVAFADGSPASGLVYSFAGLPDGLDNLSFSDNDGVSFGYVPAADADGCDAAVTHVRISFGGTMSGDAGAGSPAFTVRFRVAVR